MTRKKLMVQLFTIQRLLEAREMISHIELHKNV